MKQPLTVLVTGGAGFIGSHTCDLLVALGHTVRVLDILDPQIHGTARLRPSWLHPAVELVTGDVRVRDDLVRALHGVDIVYHFAAQTGVGQSMYEIHGYYDVNVGGTAMLLDVLANVPHAVRRIILSSSRAVYGEGAYLCRSCGPVSPPPRKRSDLEAARWQIACSSCGGALLPVATGEGKPLAPISFYAETKRCQEELLRIFTGSYGIPCTVLRYFNVYGTRQALSNPYTGIGSIFVTRALDGRHIAIYEDGHQGRDFVNVRDVVQANILALNRETPGVETFNVGSGERLTVLDLARHICSELGVPEDFRYQGEFRVGDIRDCYADLSASRSILGYRPDVSFTAGVSELVSWARGESRCDRLSEAVQALKSRKLM
jgi:dTDP-L-rhamnose 4-epimerase